MKEGVFREVVTVTEKDSVGLQELWCEWFRCPACGKSNIVKWADYCRDCGARVEWRLGE